MDPDRLPPEDDSELEKALSDLESVLLRIPGAGHLVADLRELRALLYSRRPARIAVIGRRGAGKSSLANALLGALVRPVDAVTDTTQSAAWTLLEQGTRRLHWLDTPGLRPGQDDGRRDLVRRALTRDPPDLIVVACRATQVDAGIDEDVAEVRWLLERLGKRSAGAPPVLGVVTRVDEMPPVSQKAPPYSSDKKLQIDRAAETFQQALEREKVPVKKVLAVGAYQRFFSDGTRAVDWRYNLDKLCEEMIELLPREAQAESARSFELADAVRRKIALRAVHATTSLAFLVGTTPLPVADLVMLAPLQTLMVTAIMVVAGRGSSMRGASEWLAGLGVNVGAGYAFREVARGLIKLVPGLGGAVAGMVAAGGTWALGMSAIRYFLDGSTVEEARRTYEEERARKEIPLLTDGSEHRVAPVAPAAEVREPEPEPAATPPEK